MQDIRFKAFRHRHCLEEKPFIYIITNMVSKEKISKKIQRSQGQLIIGSIPTKPSSIKHRLYVWLEFMILERKAHGVIISFIRSPDRP